MLLFIPTLGREGKQITLTSIPDRWKEKTFLVCPKSESHDWQNRIDVPEYCIGNIGKTRQFIIENSSDKHVGMMDDDITICLRDPVKKTRRTKLEDIGEYLDLMESWLESGDVYCSNGASFMSHERDDEYFYGKSFGAHFLDRDYFAEKNIRFDALNYFEDFHICLSVLESGKRLHLTGKYIGTEFKANSAGGCSINRTSENNRNSMHEFQKIHPRYVSLNEEAGAKNQNVEVGVKMRIAFKKAYDENVMKGNSLADLLG